MGYFGLAEDDIGRQGGKMSRHEPDETGMECVVVQDRSVNRFDSQGNE
jgi:hypothetical protein